MPRTPISDSIALIAGTAREVASYIEDEVQNLLLATKAFKKVFVLIIESDSKDQTVEKLKQLKNRYGNIDFISLGTLNETIARRTERLAFCRNHIIDALKQNPRYAAVDYILMADLDGMNTLLSPAKIAQCWQTNVDWDVVCANQHDFYFDVYALRHPDWCPVDCYYQQQRLEAILGKETSDFLAVQSKQIQIKAELGLIEVDSAFGGFAIYKKEAYLSGRYVGRVADRDICEHVPFHEAIRKQGYRIFINPALINCTRPTETVVHKPKKYSTFFISLVQSFGIALFGKKRFYKYLDRLKKE